MISVASSRLRLFLLGAVGLSLAACGGESDNDAGSGGQVAGSAGSGGSGDVGDAGGSNVGGSAGVAGAGAGGGGSSGTAGTNAGGSGGGTPPPCTNPVPAYGEQSGLVKCAEGWIHREKEGTCQNSLPAETPTCGGVVCDKGMYPFCGPLNGPGTGYMCHYGCVQDSDCAANELCDCGDKIGQCVKAYCRTDADCQNGFHCVETANNITCSRTNVYACQTPGDACVTDADCKFGACMVHSPGQAGDSRQCEGAAGCGRPFLVDSVARLAPVVSSSDYARSLSLGPLDLCDDEREAVAAEWARLGAMEHASVAAFARFSLQLLSLGAPRSLLVEATAAMDDERRHAELCFGLASHFAGHPLGPGKLAVDGALDRLDLSDVTVDTFLEGCIGETVAALEAGHAASLAEGEALREPLASLAEDEGRHAALAWRFVAWAVEQDGSLGARLLEQMDEELARPVVEGRSPHRKALGRCGLLDGEGKSEIRRAALREVVAPCLRALVGSRAREAQAAQVA